MMFTCGGQVEKWWKSDAVVEKCCCRLLFETVSTSPNDLCLCLRTVAMAVLSRCCFS